MVFIRELSIFDSLKNRFDVVFHAAWYKTFLVVDVLQFSIQLMHIGRKNIQPAQFDRIDRHVESLEAIVVLDRAFRSTFPAWRCPWRVLRSIR